MSKQFISFAGGIIAVVVLIATCLATQEVRPDVAMLISFSALGIVVAGRELDSIRSLEDLQEIRNGVVKQMGELRDKFNSRADAQNDLPGRFEGEERDQWNQLNDQVKAIDKRMADLRDANDMQQRWEELEEGERRRTSNDRQNRNINDPDSDRLAEITPQTRALAFQAWTRVQMELPLKRSHKKACKLLRFNPRRKKLDMRSPFHTEEIREIQNQLSLGHRSQRAQILKRAMSASTATEGQEFVPQGFMNMLEEALFFHARIRDLVDIWRTDSGNPVPWPTASDQEEGEWIGESTTVTEADPSTGNVLFGAHKVSSKLIKVPTELMEDSAFNLASWLPGVIGRRIGRTVNRGGTTGDGVNKMTGIITSSTLGWTAPAAGSLAFSDFVRLEHSVDPLDRENGTYMFHDNTLLAIRLLVDADGRPLWQPGLNLGVPDRFNGRLISINQYMDSTLVSGQKPVVFGNMRKYKMREVRGIRLYRLEELFRTTDQDGFVAFQRFDGKLLDAGTNPIKHILMP